MSDLFGNTLDTMTAFSNAIAKNPYTGAVIETGSYHPSDQDVFNRFLENFDLYVAKHCLDSPGQKV